MAVVHYYDFDHILAIADVIFRFVKKVNIKAFKISF